MTPTELQIKRIAIGLELKKSRLKLLLTQTDLEKLSGLSRTTISKLEGAWGPTMLDSLIIYQHTIANYNPPTT